MVFLKLHVPMSGLFLAVCIAGCAATPAVSPVAEDSELGRLLALNADARGGEARLGSLQAMRLTLYLEEPTFEVTGHYVATRDGHVRVDIYAGGHRAFTEAIGPAGGWQWQGGETQTMPLSADGYPALRRGLVSNLFALYEWPQQGYNLRLGADPDNRHRLIIAEEADGFTKRLWLNRETHLVAREYETSALHPDIDDTPTEQYSTVREWMDVGGIKIPRVNEKVDVETGEVMQRVEMRRIDLVFSGDPEPEWMAPGYFKAPEFR